MEQIAYRRVAAELRQQIEVGQYAPGDRLPPERDLTELFQVSRPTIREALSLLRKEGRVVIEHGKGAFVAPPRTVQRLSRSRLGKAARDADRGAFFGDAAIGGFTPSVSVRVWFEPADAETASLLQISEGDEVTVRDRVMRANGLAVQLATSRLPRNVTRDTLIEQVDTGPGGTYSRLEHAGFTLAECFPERVSSRAATADEATTMQLAQGVPILVVTRIAITTDGMPLEVNVMRMAADRYELLYDVSTR